MTEDAMWRRIIKLWPGHAVRVRAEDGGVDPGFPDGILSAAASQLDVPRGAEIARAQGTAFVELKVWPGTFRPLQVPWHVDAIQRGAICYVIAGVSRGQYWLGLAEEYANCLIRREAPSNTHHLQEILDMIYVRLTGTYPQDRS